MRSRAALASAMIFALGLSACANTFTGPRRLVATGLIDDGNSMKRACPVGEQPNQRRDAKVAGPIINLSEEFYDTACASLRDKDNPLLARQMVRAGVTLNRVRCNDFFAMRAGNQTRERSLRGLVAPVSAVLAGLIGIVDLDVGLTRQEAIQLLALSQGGAVALLDLYEAEFLFGAANVNSVRTLTMRALDEHAAGIQGELSFYDAARHLIDHQMICTPANILEMSQKAIRDGRVEQASFNGGASRSAGSDTTTVTALAASLRTTSLTADQVGSLWWLADEVRKAKGAPIDTNVLAVIQKRLEGLNPNPVGGTAAAPVPDIELVTLLTPQLDRLSPEAKAGFAVDVRRIRAEAAKAAPPALLERTGKIGFTLPTPSGDPSRAVEIEVAPVSTAATES